MSARVQDSARRPRTRLVLWISLATAVVVAVLVAVLATSGQAGQTTANSPLLGRKAPAIDGRSLLNGGQTVALSTLAGKWVLVNFAASWCVPCRGEMPQLLDFAGGHARTDNATILTVAYDEGDVSNLTSWLRTSHASWPAVDDGQAVVNYGVSGIPESYLVDPEGTVVAKYVGGVVAAQLNSFIAKSTGGTA
jgi:cytochrome c biogenesis protein CcmG/thiol:disulfide interchange protein DsbE